MSPRTSLGLRTRLTDAARPIRVVTSAGRTVLVLGAVAAVAAARTGFDELWIIALLCLLLLLTGLPFVLVPAPVRARLELRPTRVLHGGSSTVTLRVTSLGRLPLWSTVALVPVDGRRQGVVLPTVRRDGTATAELSAAGERRGVLDVGPAVHVRTDPIGLFRREEPWTAAAELYVRPRMIDVEAIAPGSVRDLEGVPSDQLSTSDLAFHALREYVRGDDLRHVHWRSSARTGELHVRQYEDTRRSHAAVVVDTDATSYADGDELELALSVVASLVVQLARGEHDLTFVCGDEHLAAGTVGEILDSCCRAELGTSPLLTTASTTAAFADRASQLVLVTGSRVDAGALGAVRGLFPAEMGFLAFRADPAAPRVTVTTTHPRIATVPSLELLPAALVGLTAPAVGSPA